MFAGYAVAAIAVVIVYIIWKVKNFFRYWEGKGIPYLTFAENIVHIREIGSKSYKVALRNLYKKYGRLFGYFSINQPVLFVADPELIKQIMVKDFASFTDRFEGQRTGHKLFDIMVSNLSGQEWKETRDIITPAFTSGKMRQMISAVEETSEYTVESFVAAAQRRENISVKELFGAYSMDIIARIAFATNLNSHKDPNSPFVKNAMEAFGPKSSYRFTFIFMFPKISRLLKLAPIPDHVSNFFEDVARKVVEHRGENPQNANDLLQLLLNASKEEHLQKEKLSGKAAKQVLTMESIVAQSALFFLAGYETTGTILSLIAYYLARNPEVQETLIKEIDSLDKTERLAYETVNSMQYLDAVINESLRIGGTIFSHGRLCTEDTQVKDIKVKKGTLVMIPIDAMMNDPEFFSEPDKFKPERFLPGNKEAIKPYTFIPFGEGPRHCLGMRLAVMVIKVVVIKLLQRVKMTTCSQTPVPLEELPWRVVQNFKKPIILGAVERK